MSAEEPEVVKWYTRARKFPQLIGRTPDGTRIPFGPYTLTQAFAAGLLLIVAWKTTFLWAQFGLFTNAGILLAALFGTVWGLGRVPFGARNPITFTAGILRALFAPQTGRIRGQRVRIKRPHRLTHRIIIATPIGSPVVATTAASTPATATTPTPSRAASTHALAQQPAPPAAAMPRPVSPAPALTGVQSLLAGAGAREESPL